MSDSVLSDEPQFGEFATFYDDAWCTHFPRKARIGNYLTPGRIQSCRYFVDCDLG